MKGLGRRFAPDPRDGRYQMQPLLEDVPTPRRNWKYGWNLGARLDQGQTGTCVAHAWVHLAENGPITRLGTLDPFALYREIVRDDEWTENDHESGAPSNDALQFGTSVRAGAKAMQRRGLIGEYRWAWDLATATDWLHLRGSLVIGTNWYEGMFATDEDGFIHPTGRLMGGHAVVLDGINLDREEVRGLNSWGPSFGYGHGWMFRMSFETLERLIREDGEVCAPTELKGGA